MAAGIGRTSDVGFRPPAGDDKVQILRFYKPFWKTFLVAHAIKELRWIDIEPKALDGSLRHLQKHMDGGSH